MMTRRQRAMEYCFQRGMCAYHAQVIVEKAIAGEDNENAKERWDDPTEDPETSLALLIPSIIRAKYAWIRENCPQAW